MAAQEGVHPTPKAREMPTLGDLLTDNVKVGGLHILAKAIDDGAIEGTLRSVQEMIDLMHKNIEQLRALTETSGG